MLRDSWLKWFERRIQLGRSGRTGRRLTRRRGARTLQTHAAWIAQELEQRTLLTHYIVDNPIDENDGDTSAGNLSLREAIGLANANAGVDVITFANGFAGTTLQLTMGPLTVTDSLSIFGSENPITVTGSGFIVQKFTPGAPLNFNMTGIGVNGTTSGPGLLIRASNEALINSYITDSFFHNAATQGVRVSTTSGGEVRLTLTNVAIRSNGDVTLSPGMAVDVGVVGQAQSLTTPGKFASVKLNMTNVQFIDNTLEGLDITTATGGKFETLQPVTNATFQGNGFASQRNQIDAVATGPGSSIIARFNEVTANNAYKAGFSFEASAGGNVAAIIQNSSATGAFADGFSMRIDGAGTTGSAAIQNFVGDGAGSSGAEFNVTNGAILRVNQFNNVSLQNTVWSGLDVNLTIGRIDAFNGSNVNVSGGMQSGMDLYLRQGFAKMTIDGLIADNNFERGVQILNIVGAQSFIELNNVSMQGNKTRQPLYAVSNVNDTNVSRLDLAINGGTITSAGTAINSSIYTMVDGGSIGNFSFNNLDVTNSTWGAFNSRYDNGASGRYEITGTTATNAAAVPLALFVLRGSKVTGNFDGLDVSNSGPGGTGQAIRIDVTGHGTTGTFAFNDVTADNSSGRGIHLLYANAASGNITKFDDISAQNAQQDGVLVDVRGASQLTSFVGNGIDVTGAGQSGDTTHDGFELLVQNLNTTASMNVQRLTANNAAGRGINVQLPYLATASVVIDGFSASNNGLEGLNIEAGATVAGARLQNTIFRNGTVNNNGTAVPSSGVVTRVAGAGTAATITFDNVDAAGNTLSGFDTLVNNRGNLTMGVNNGSSGNNNAVNGFRFIADGPFTRAALKSTSGGNSFNTNVDDGLFVQLTNGVLVSDLTLRAGGSNNGKNGGVIDIDDLSGVTVNNIFLGGGSSFSNNAESGLVVSIDSVLGLNNMTIDGVAAAANLAGAAGVNTTIVNTTLSNLAVTNVSAQNNNGDGLKLLLDDVTVTGNFDLTGFNTSGNAGDGVDLNLINGTTIALTMTLGGRSAVNAGDGVKVIATDASGVSIGNMAISASNLILDGNSGNGLTVDFNALNGISALDLSGITSTNNSGDQIFAQLVDMASPLAISFDDVIATGLGAGGGTGDGIDLTINNTTATSLGLNRINASSNGGDGLKLTLLNNASALAASIDVGTFNNNGGNGIGINLTDSNATIDVTNSTFATLGTTASASGNGNDGMRVRLNNADLTLNTVDHIVFDNNGRIGVNIEGATPSRFMSSTSFTNNTITNNGSFGFRGVFNGGDFDISIGSRTNPGQGNLFDGNGGAGISVDMIQDSEGRLAIVDNTIINTSDDGNANTIFQGEGIFVRMLGTANPAQATNTLVDSDGGPGLLIRNNRIGINGVGGAAGNAGTGINFDVQERSVIDGLHIHDNLVENSGLDGLNFRRLDEVIVDDFQILGNTFNDNGANGVQILGQNDDNSVMDVDLSENDIMGNGVNGVVLQVNADAGLNINMDDNTIVQNGVDGVAMFQTVLDIADQRRILGNAERNVIAENERFGFNLSSVLSGFEFSDNTIGMQTDEFDQVIYLGNGSTGVQMDGPGSSIWTGNDIRANGRLVIEDRTQGHGFDIQGVGFKDVTMIDNLIRENYQDGIEFLNAAATGTFTLEMVDNRVQSNRGRGLDILNRSSGTVGANSLITIYRGTTGNTFNSNGEEGIYAVNTASSTQTQDVFANTPLLQDGVVNSSPTLSLVIDHATISNNGSPENVPNMLASAGVVMRVGSSDSAPLQSATQPVTNQFATSNFSTAGDITGRVFPSFNNGGVFMQLTSSTLAGNFGEDVFIHGYRSTVVPGTLSGTWTDTEFNVSGDGDPLARLDLQWAGNSYQSIDVSNVDRRGTPDGEAGAFYNNAEGTFKSRSEDLTPPGPFDADAASRRRNAQRVPARGDLPPDKATSLGDNFLYPGMGESTFRVTTGGGGLPPGFFGVGFTGPTVFGELSFTWGTY